MKVLEKVIFAFMNGLQTTQNFIFSRHDARIVMIESHVIPVVNSAKEVSPYGDLQDSRDSLEEDVDVVSKFQQLATVFENKDLKWTSSWFTVHKIIWSVTQSDNTYKSPVYRRVYPGEKSRSCFHCTKSFAVSWNLEHRMTVHAGSKEPFSCFHRK